MEKGLRSLDYYGVHFKQLRIGINRNMWDESTNFMAPHKPFLLFSVMDLIAQDHFRLGIVELSPELIEQFNKYWSTFYDNSRSAKINQPFFYLRTSPFWKLIPVEGKEKELEETDDASSITHFNRISKGAKIDHELLRFFQNRDNRGFLRETILQSYFSAEKHTLLRSLAIESPAVSTVATREDLSIKIKSEKNGNLASIYVELSDVPKIPANEIPTKRECQGYAYISMAQFCNIAEAHGISRSKASNAFGGDKRRRLVIPERIARVYGGVNFVLLSAVIDYFSVIGIDW